jgi:hypothetical protein
MKSAITLGLSAFLLLTFSVNGLAVTREVNLRDQRQELREERTEFIKSQRCDMATVRVDGVNARYELNRQRIGQIRNRFSDQIQNLLDKIEEAGIDTTNARTLGEELKTKMQELDTLVISKISKVEELRDSACESDQLDLREIREEIRVIQLDIVSKNQEIKSFYQDELRPELKSLREQYVATLSLNEEGEDE